MSFDWPDYLEIAQELARLAKNAPPKLQEARYRASISRAYYAVFCKACDHLRNHDSKEELQDLNEEQQYTHQYVRKTFQTSKDLKCKQIGFALYRMGQCRIIADYKLDTTELGDLPDKSRLVLIWAEQTLNNLNRLQKK